MRESQAPRLRWNGRAINPLRNAFSKRCDAVVLLDPEGSTEMGRRKVLRRVSQ
jgi:hypothetical protein